MTCRRNILKAAASAAIIPFLPRTALALTNDGPPVARTVDARDRRFGLDLPDPYRWMENAGDPDWEPFMRGQAAYARSQLDAFPVRDAIAGRIDELSGDLAVPYKVQHVQGMIFIERRPAGANSYKLYVRSRKDAEDRLLYDPTLEIDASGSHRSMDSWSVSPDGKHVAFGSSLAGSEDSIVRIINSEDGSFLSDALDRAQYARLAWLPDSSGFFISRLHESATRGASDYYQNSVVWLHSLGTDQQEDIRIVGGGDRIDGYQIASAEFPAAITAADSEWVLLQASGAVRRHNPVFAARLDDICAGQASWKRLVALEDEVTNFALKNDDFYYVSERDAPNGQVFLLSLTALPELEARLVAKETEYPIEPTAHGNLMVAASDGVYFVRTHGGPQVVYRIGSDGNTTALPMPFEAGVRELFANVEANGIDVRIGGWVEPIGIWQYKPDTDLFARTGLSRAAIPNLDRFESFQISAAARDGTRIPVSVVRLRALPRDGSAPCLARCYSAYGRSATPRFNVQALAFLERGGVLAQVHARGGGEYGSRWSKAGRKETKPNTWRDFIDGCEALIGERLVARNRLTIFGSSAGGVAVGRAMTERPDLFAGAIFNVAFTNPTRIEAEPSGPAQYDEYGDPSIATEYRALYEMDTYQHITNKRAYPAVLIMHGMTDPRVSPWHSAKLAARLQSASTDPVLLRVTFDAGHGAGSTRSQVDEQWADIISFVLKAQN